MYLLSGFSDQVIFYLQKISVLIIGSCQCRLINNHRRSLKVQLWICKLFLLSRAIDPFSFSHVICIIGCLFPSC